jgi:hypothetical protein
MRGSVAAVTAGHIEGGGIRTQVSLQCFEYGGPILRVLRRAVRILLLFTYK